MERPGRYINGELNSSHRSPEGRVSIVLAYPDTYEVGLSNLGLQILYELVNERDDALAERVYAPWIDMEKEMRRAGVPLFSLESHRPVVEFDLLGFTLQYELTYTNILNMLDLAGLPVFAADREEDQPLVVGGGPGAFAPEPLAPFFDAFAIGDGEAILPEIIDAVRELKRSGASRAEMLAALAEIPGVYVPSFYEADRGKIRRRILKDLNEAPLVSKPIVPFIDTVHDRCVVEVMRGCTRGCRFCQAGIVYRPVRERREDEVLKSTESVVASTGYEEISLSSLSSADYTPVADVLGALAERYGREVSLSLSSLRVDSFSVDLVNEIARGKRTGLTFAPEAGTQRLRDVINKGVSDENLFEAVRAAFEAGWHRIKLYFMIGLPTETREDIEGIAELAKEVAAIGFKTLPKGRRGRLSVVVSVSSFVPKAHTPFQWFGQNTLDEIEEKQQILKDKVRGRGLSLRWHDPKVSALEGVIARGDRRLAAAIHEAWRRGCTFDAWDDEYRYDVWLEAFKTVGIEPSFYANRERETGEVLPWSHIDPGVTEEFLRSEWDRALAGSITPDCREERCSDCGVCPRFKVKNVLAKRGRGGQAAS